MLVALVVAEVDQIGSRPITADHKETAFVVWLVLAGASFWFYKPLTYYERPLTPAELHRHAIVDLWDLRCVGCPLTDGLCLPPAAKP